LQTYGGMHCGGMHCFINSLRQGVAGIAGSNPDGGMDVCNV